MHKIKDPTVLVYLICVHTGLSLLDRSMLYGMISVKENHTHFVKSTFAI